MMKDPGSNAASNDSADYDSCTHLVVFVFVKSLSVLILPLSVFI